MKKCQQREKHMTVSGLDGRPKGFSLRGRPDMQMKLLRQALVEQLESEHSPALISVEYVHAPYYRMER
jgi:hypothetical protein